jgi:predicted Zn-dependent protease with MMP-like domain
MRLSRKRFEALVLAAMETIPEPIRAHMDNVDITIERWPTPLQRASLELDSTESLFGLYEGVPLTERGVIAQPLLPDKITIFQGPLEEVCATESEMAAEIRKTVIHEIAHHFGFDEGRLADLGYE